MILSLSGHFGRSFTPSIQVIKENKPLCGIETDTRREKHTEQWESTKWQSRKPLNWLFRIYHDLCIEEVGVTY